MPPKKRAQLKIIDEWHMKLLGGLIADLKSVREGEDTLLDRTMVLYGSNFGDANAHTCFNMPMILAGGGGNWRAWMSGFGTGRVRYSALCFCS